MRWLCFTILALYSASLLYIEGQGTQQDVRPYVSDITSPESALFGINTTLNAFLLGACALVFGIAFLVGRRTRASFRRQAFYASQVLVFSYLAVDERFLIHEAVGNRLHIGDQWPLLAVAAVEVVMLVGCGELLRRSRRTRLYLLVGGALFAVMIAIDRFAPKDGFLRLSLEDLTKVWSTAFLLLFGFENLSAELDELGGEPHSV